MKLHLKMLNQKKGFTLIEVMLVMVILSLILTMTGGMFLDLFRTKKTVEEQQSLSSTVLSFYNQIEKKVKWANGVSSLNPFTFTTLEEGVEVEHTISLDGGNNRLVDSTDVDSSFLTPENIKVTSFSVEDNSADTYPLGDSDHLPSLKFTLTLESEEITTYSLESSFVLSVRRQEIALD